MTTRPVAGLTIAVAAVIVLAAVAMAGGAALGAIGVREVRIVVRHSRFDVATVEAEPGETVRFVLENTDPIDHEFIVGDAPVQLAHERGTEAHHPPRPGEITVPAGTTRSTTVTFPTSPQTTLFGCHLPGHYAFGMVGTVRVG